VHEPLDRAKELVRAGKLQPAIELLVAAAAQERGPRGRFLRRTQAAGLMVDAGLERVAMPILRELIEQIEQHQLERWESGEVVAQPLALLYRCLERTGEDPHGCEELYLRICRLDPLQAIRLVGAGGGRG
jgi:type VI secretion system protein ImpA